MNFEKEIRARLATPYPSAPYLMAGDDEATERGILSSRGSSDLEEIELMEARSWPDYITLHATLSAVPIEDHKTQVDLTLAGRTLTPQSFYRREALLEDVQEVGEDARYQAIQVKYKGFGHYVKDAKTYIFQGEKLDNFKVGLEMDQEIFRKDFAFQSQSLLHQKEFPQGDFWLTTSPNGVTGERLYPLLAYGGYFKRGLDLKKMEPIFALIKQGENESTALQLLRASELRQMGILPPRVRREGGEEWIFCDPVKGEVMMSLAGALISGAARLKIYDAEGIDSCLYTSMAYEQPDPSTNHITLTFKPL
ncbi:MAG: hypothetical protein J0H12_07595 [Candidatus Paracaedimonas acanthamoebae]|uniref:Uncharacterized protein n=1 Tax=Candidatus Paracaedimonas acanthamoebae TaxID=244581 RepID=A0A8J7Q1S2_9PROT|nr:hypothetical protein [Candidatus Paracaedimonas acanthamoebae]